MASEDNTVQYIFRTGNQPQRAASEGLVDGVTCKRRRIGDPGMLLAEYSIRKLPAMLANRLGSLLRSCHSWLASGSHPRQTCLLLSICG